MKSLNSILDLKERRNAKPGVFSATHKYLQIERAQLIGTRMINKHVWFGSGVSEMDKQLSESNKHLILSFRVKCDRCRWD